ncbi:hypothetical protein EG329_003207 [Mollisiaceae sp. DMI_Dod_QoI]|nr:hypothetical protein EG329_003207 [Helotiales sp. DMI_Dod_QoI]
MTRSKNIYKDEIDFATLALQDAEFGKALKSNGQLDFSNPESVQQLTKSLLRRDFNLKIILPPDRLCPPVHNRLNYVLWIQDLLDTTNESYNDSYDPEREVLGVDVGTGASCIYPLLGCSQRPQWRFAGTGEIYARIDIDEKSLQFARQNVQDNGLQNRIKLLKTELGDLLLPLDRMGFENIDFSMCNPPFYESKADMLTSAAAKQRPPFTACTGSETEMVTAGGEIAFVSRMIDESFILKDRVQWYTSMLGKFSSVGVIVQKLREKGLDNYAVTEFVQGSKTRRWAIAWSFGDLRPLMCVSRGVSSLQKSLLPFPSEYLVTSEEEHTKISRRVNETLSQLPLKWKWREAICTGIGFSAKAVWSRAARRHVTKAESENMEEDDMALGFKIHVEQLPGGQPGSRTTPKPQIPLALSTPQTSLTKARATLIRPFKSHTPSFPKFGLLPKEIRLQIWEASFVPRVHELHPCAKLYNDRMTFRSNSSLTPSIFHVCHESRIVALKHYELMQYQPPQSGTSGKGILRFYFCPELDTLLLNSLMGLFIMFMLLEDEEDYVGVGVMKGWKRVAFDAERAQLISLLSGIAGHSPQPRFKAVFPSLQELIIAFDYTSKGKTRFRTSVWPGENGTSLREVRLPQSLAAEEGELESTIFDTIFKPMREYLSNDYKDEVNGVPIMTVAKVKRKAFIRGDIRYAFRKTCSFFGLRPRGVFRRL